MAIQGNKKGDEAIPWPLECCLWSGKPGFREAEFPPTKSCRPSSSIPYKERI